jgi:DNA-binding response OmpR family regulator
MEGLGWQLAAEVPALDAPTIVIQIHDKAEVLRAISRHRETGLVLLDGCMPDWGDTLPLIPELRNLYTGPMIALSSLPELRIEMVKAGCDEECAPTDLDHLNDLVLEAFARSGLATE